VLNRDFQASRREYLATREMSYKIWHAMVAEGKVENAEFAKQKIRSREEYFVLRPLDVDSPVIKEYK